MRTLAGPALAAAVGGRLLPAALAMGCEGDGRGVGLRAVIADDSMDTGKGHMTKLGSQAMVDSMETVARS